MFPAAFVLFLDIGVVASFFSALIAKAFITILGGYFLIIFLDATAQNKSLKVGLKSILASLLQLTGYGLGFLLNAFSVFVLGKKDGMELGASK